MGNSNETFTWKWLQIEVLIFVKVKVLNLWMKNPTYNKLTAMHMFAWSKGLKTGIYYLRTRAKAAPQQFTIDPSANKIVVEDEEEGCLMCSG